MSSQVAEAREFVTGALTKVANPGKAPGMQAYMKTDMPFYGVQKEGRTAILRQLVQDFEPADRLDYEDLVLGLWDLPHREEKYLALAFARHFRTFIVPGSLPLYRRLIAEGAWWDFVDEIATKLVRHLILEHPTETWAAVDEWIEDEEMWLRRTAILCQVGAKDRTDVDRLFRFCAQQAFEKEFFIRKAIGWALREYAKTDPMAVARFVTEHRDQLSGLSFREASKHIGLLVR